MSHVYLHATDMDPSLQTLRKSVTYDEGSGTVLLEDKDQVRACALDANSTQATWAVAPGEGEPITALHASLDGSMLAMQRSSAFLQIVHIRSSKMFVQGPRSKSRLLCFFWCPSAACDLVMTTEHGLELYQQLSKGQGLRYMGSRKHPTSWCIYSHESRIALLATGEGGLWLQAYQVTNDAVLRLPPFQLGPSASRQASPKAGPSQRVSSKDIKVLTMYSRIYCAHIDYRQRRLALYRFYKDAVMLQHSYEIFSRHVELSVHDNMLLVHHLDSSTVLLLDVRARSNGPIAAPLPLTVTTRDKNDQSLPSSMPALSSRDPLQHEGKVELASCMSAAVSTAGSATSDGPEHLDSGHWRFEAPNLILDTEAGKVWRCEVDIAAVARTCSEWPLLLAFLQRRQPAAHPTCDIKSLLLTIVKGALLEQLDMASVWQIFDAVALGYAEACANKQGSSGVSVSPDSTGRASRLSMPVLSPQEMEVKVLRWLHEEEATDVQYLEAAIAEYLSSCSRHGIGVPPGLYLLAVDVALLTAHPHQVVAALHEQKGGWDSARMASHLERLARKGGLAEGWHLALDMYTRLGMHDRQCQMLLSKGKVVQALQCAQRHQLMSIDPEAFLSKAAGTGDLLIFTAVYRVCYQLVEPQIEQYSTLLRRHNALLSQSKLQHDESGSIPYAHQSA
ncbi:hypothetical protein WJX77_003973 [Trebouxia sp. C0004]